jgi:signal transduction histidine kinase/ligand-binding sensor domain-containing protein
MKRTEYLFLLATLALPCRVFGEQLPMMVFSARDGLGTTVSRIVVDSKGFVWIPGCEGLARFDGNGFRLYSQDDGLPAGCVQDIVERKDGTYWIAAQDQVCLFDPRPNVRRFRCESPNLGTIAVLLEDERGLWCGTDTGLWLRPAGASKSSKFVRTVESDSTGRSIQVGRLLKDTRGDVWATTLSGLFRFRTDGRIDRWTTSQGFTIDPGTAISETHGSIWVGTQEALVQLGIEPDSGEARIAARFGRPDGLPSGYTTDVRQWHGSVWAATFQGLARQLPSGRWQAVQLDPSVNAFPLERLAVDVLGNLWVGTDGGGAARISGSGFSSFTQRDGLAPGKISAIFEDGNGVLNAVTKDETSYSINRFDGYRFQRVRVKAPSGIGWGWSWSQIIAHSRSGDWWLATGSGLLRYRKRLDNIPRLQGPEVGLPAGSTFRVFEDSSGAIWASKLGMENHGLYRRDPTTGRFETLDESRGLPSLGEHANCPAVFAEDGAGQVWIGMLEGGLVRFRGGKFQQFPTAAGAPDRGVCALFIDRQDRLWIATRRKGLLRVDDPSAADPVFSAYTKTNGLSSNTVLALAEDSTGRIYAASGSCVDRLDPATGRIHHFTSADGLLPGEFKVAFRDRNGAIWFGGDQGLVRFEPQRDERMSLPAVLIYSIRINGEPRPISDLGETEPALLSLSPSERQVQVDFGGFRHDLLYQTRLSGVDGDWTRPSPSRSIHYLSLAPGNYELSIRAVGGDGSVSPAPARVRFEIAAPVWQRWWFLLAGAAVLSAIVYAAHRYHLAQAVALERVRTRIASDLHDDIGSNLSVISGLSEVLRQQAHGIAPQMADPLSLISEVSSRSMEAMADIVWAIDPRKDRLRDLAQRMRRWASDALAGRPIELNFIAPEDDLSLDAEMRREIYLVFKEAVHNIVRHSGCTRMSVSLRKEGSALVLHVEDNGKGFVPSQATQGQGLASIRRRAARLGGEVRIQSGTGGTSVVVRVPLRAKPARQPVI